MKSKSVAVAFPTIPIIFVAGVRPGTRIPIHNTMGMAVTDLNEETRTETSVEVMEKSFGVKFFFGNQEVDFEKEKDLKKVIDVFLEKSNFEGGLKIVSNNYKIFSGSSDSGMAALVTALNDLFELNLNLNELADIAMIGSESSIRSLYGGLNEIYTEGLEKPVGELLASDKELEKIRIFAMGFNYPSRYSAQEIFKINQSNPEFKYRLLEVPKWEKAIKDGLKEKNFEKVFDVAERNCRNAHYLFECSGRVMRKKEMMIASMDVCEIRTELKLPVYWVAGGGKVISAITWEPFAEKVLIELRKRGQNPIEYKVGSGAKIVKSE
jgi:mevalonate pyrophosphate decarboxylase